LTKSSIHFLERWIKYIEGLGIHEFFWIGREEHLQKKSILCEFLTHPTRKAYLIGFDNLPQELMKEIDGKTITINNF
jgi:hypothetical protein